MVKFLDVENGVDPIQKKKVVARCLFTKFLVENGVNPNVKNNSG